MQEMLHLDVPIHGFDTFTGLPLPWCGEPAGAYSTGGIVPVLSEGKVVFHKGLFRDTIRPFLEQAGGSAFLPYANIDCRLFTLMLDILEAMHGRIVAGTILVFVTRRGGKICFERGGNPASDLDGSMSIWPFR